MPEEFEGPLTANQFKQVFLYFGQRVGALASVVTAFSTVGSALVAIDLAIAGNFSVGSNFLALSAVSAAATWVTWRLTKAAWAKRQSLNLNQPSGFSADKGT